MLKGHLEEQATLLAACASTAARLSSKRVTGTGIKEAWFSSRVPLLLLRRIKEKGKERSKHLEVAHGSVAFPSSEQCAERKLPCG